MEHLDVLIVGAGLSGIGAAHHLANECPWVNFGIVEARDRIGGTWDLFRYPGIRSDSDMFTFSYPFRPWTEDRSIADGASIRRYIEDTATADGTDTRIRFGTKVTTAEWSTDDQRWTITMANVHSGEVSQLTCGFLFSCTGYYRYDAGYTPDFDGMDDFAGTIIHPQSWPEDFDPSGKRIVVIGSGATAITLVPELARTAEHVVMLQRSPTYVAPLPTRNPVTRTLRKLLPQRAQGTALRWTNAMATQGMYRLSRKRPAMVKKALRRGLEAHLPEGFPVDVHFNPRYDPWDQRLCVDSDAALLNAISSGQVSVVTDGVDRFVSEGVRCTSGDVERADVVVTATGLDMLFLGGMAVRIDGEELVPKDHLTYRGAMLSNVPNLAFAVGYTNASWTLRSDLTCAYVARLLQHMRDIGATECRPIPAADVRTDGNLMGLTSGYVMRAADRFPAQGNSGAWRMSQSYLSDYRQSRRLPMEDGIMRFRGWAAADSAPTRPTTAAASVR